jgi:penicillin-binding protein 1C
MNTLHDEHPSRLPEKIAEISLPDSMPLAASTPVPSIPKIVYPHDGGILAIDPEIPLTRQKVLLKASSRSEVYDWYLDGEKLSSLSDPLLWPLTRGKKHLEIKNSDHQTVDSISFSVR